jgi:putative Mg2+ transporter-C (MgtC) family protein
MYLEVHVAHFFAVIGSDGIFALRLMVAMLLGGLVGMERQTRGRAAGLRTNILVCLGSAAIIIAFQKLSLDLNVGAESIVRMDPARAAAGVITGIGFLGAGTIIKTKDFVRGLTTAASIWVVSAIGVTVGLGEYTIATVLTLLVLISLYALHRIPISGDRYMSLQLNWIGDLQLLSEVTDQLVQQRVQIKSSSVKRQPNTQKCNVILGLRMTREKHVREILSIFKKTHDSTRLAGADEDSQGRMSHYFQCSSPIVL